MNDFKGHTDPVFRLDFRSIDPRLNPLKIQNNLYHHKKKRRDDVGLCFVLFLRMDERLYSKFPSSFELGVDQSV
jgi:hypothetical protein